MLCQKYACSQGRLSAHADLESDCAYLISERRCLQLGIQKQVEGSQCFSFKTLTVVVGLT